MNKTKEVAFVIGGGGFIGHNLAKKLKSQGRYVVVFDIKPRNEFVESNEFCDEYIVLDMAERSPIFEEALKIHEPKEIYQLGCMMGGAGFIFTKNNDSNIILNSALINLNLVQTLKKLGMLQSVKVFYSSSACVYPEDPNTPVCKEENVWTGQPDSSYGIEKLFSERVYLDHLRNENMPVRIARFHNIFGPEGTYTGGKEKAPAALCRKVAMAKDGDVIEIWGPGVQTRSFLHISECLEGIERLMNSSFNGPVNLGSVELITINDLAKMVIKISGKNLTIKNIEGPVGVMGRNSDNKLIQEKLNWSPSRPLEEGIRETYQWIRSQCEVG